MKLEIKTVELLIPGQFLWQVKFEGKIHEFTDPHAAQVKAAKLLKRYFKESSAFSMVHNIAVNMLDIKETELVKKLLKSKCKGITKNQYGYLKGIYERQKREW